MEGATNCGLDGICLGTVVAVFGPHSGASENRVGAEDHPREADESARVVPILQTMAFDEKIELPLTAATSAVAGATCHNLHPDATTTVVLYREQKVVATYGFRRGDLTAASIDDLTDKMRRFVNPE